MRRDRGLRRDDMATQWRGRAHRARTSSGQQSTQELASVPRQHSTLRWGWGLIPCGSNYTDKPSDERGILAKFSCLSSMRSCEPRSDGDATQTFPWMPGSKRPGDRKDENIHDQRSIGENSWTEEAWGWGCSGMHRDATRRIQQGASHVGGLHRSVLIGGLSASGWGSTRSRAMPCWAALRPSDWRLDSKSRRPCSVICPTAGAPGGLIDAGG